MRLLILLALLILLFNTTAISQKRHGRDHEGREKIAQLEKIKLIEYLNMNEETTLRFFARRSEHRQEMDQKHALLDEKIEMLDALMKSDRILLEGDLKDRIVEILMLEEEIGIARTEFINSLNDVLTYDQIANLIIFERKFKDEIRRLIFHKRKPFRE